MSKQDISQLLYGLEQLKLWFKEFQRKINDQIGRINSIVYSGNNYDENGNPIPNPILNAMQKNITLTNGVTEILLQFGSDSQNKEWYQSLTYENEYVQLVNGVVISRYDSRRNIYCNFDYRTYNTKSLSYPMNTENLYVGGTDIPPQNNIALNTAKGILDNIPLWDSTGTQTYTKEMIQQKLIQGYANLPYLTVEMDKRKVVTNAYKNDYIFSNPNCRNVWLQIDITNTNNNIYIVAGELYENVNLDLTGNIYINGAQEITMNIDATNGCVMLNHAKNILMPPDTKKPVGFVYIAENSVIDGQLILTNLSSQQLTNIVIESGGFNKSHGVIDCANCKQIYIGYNCLQNSLVQRCNCHKLILQVEADTQGALCNSVVDINRPNYDIVLSSGCCSNGDCKFAYPTQSLDNTDISQAPIEFIYFRNLYNFINTYAQSLTLQQGYDKSFFMRKHFKNLDIVGTKHNFDIIEHYKNNGPFDYYWVQYDLRLNQVVCKEDTTATDGYKYYGNELIDIQTQTFKEWGVIEGLEQQRSYIIISQNDISVQMFGEYSADSKAFIFELTSGDSFTYTNFNVLSVNLYLTNQNYDIQQLMIKGYSEYITKNFDHTAINVNFNQTQDFFIQLNENITTLTFSGQQVDDAAFDFDLGTGDKHEIVNIEISDAQIQKMGLHSGLFMGIEKYNPQRFIKNLRQFGEQCFKGATIKFTEQVINIIATDIYSSAFENAIFEQDAKTPINIVMLQHTDSNNNPQPINVHGSNIFANIDNHGVSLDIQLNFVKSASATNISNAFTNNQVIRNVTLYTTALLMDNGTFRNSSIKSVTASQKLGAATGTNVFENCTNLQSIDFVNIVSPNDAWFKGCTALTKIEGNIISIPQRCFENCTNLQTVAFYGLILIGDYAFNNCTSLTTIYTKQTSSFGNFCFAGTSLSSLTIQSFPSITNILGSNILSSNKVQTQIQYYPNSYTQGFESSAAMIYCYDFNAYTQLINIKKESGNIYDKVQLTYVKPSE